MGQKCHKCGEPLEPVFHDTALAGWDCPKCRIGVRFEA